MTPRYFTHHITQLSNVAKTFANKGLKFLNSCSFKLEVKKITKKIGFARQVYIGNLLIAIHLVYRFQCMFCNVLPMQSAHCASNSFKIQKVVLDFCVDRCETSLNWIGYKSGSAG